MKCMAFDVGSKHIGIAVGDELGISVKPLKAYRRSIYPEDLAKLIEIIKDNGVELVVVGIPYRTDGSIKGQVAAEAKKFVKDFNKNGIRAVGADERFTTRIAVESINMTGRRKKAVKGDIDSASAMIILKDYLARNIKNK